MSNVARLFFDHKSWLRTLVIDADDLAIRIQTQGKVKTVTSTDTGEVIGQWFISRGKGWGSMEFVNE